MSLNGEREKRIFPAHFFTFDWLQSETLWGSPKGWLPGGTIYYEWVYALSPSLILSLQSMWGYPLPTPCHKNNSLPFHKAREGFPAWLPSRSIGSRVRDMCRRMSCRPAPMSCLPGHPGETTYVPVRVQCLEHPPAPQGRRRSADAR